MQEDLGFGTSLCYIKRPCVKQKHKSYSDPQLYTILKTKPTDLLKARQLFKRVQGQPGLRETLSQKIKTKVKINTATINLENYIHKVKNKISRSCWVMSLSHLRDHSASLHSWQAVYQQGED